MDFDLTVEQRELGERLREFARKELRPTREEHAARHEGHHLFSRVHWDKCAQMGIQGLAVPAEHGGMGADALTSVVAMEALGHACRDSGLLFALNSHMWTCELPIARFGTPEQCQRFLPGLCTGKLVGGHAMTEPDAGSDAFAMKATARRDGDTYVLNGSKTFISNAPIADVLLVFAVTNKAAGFFGISGFLVERDTAGLSLGRPIEKMGLQSSPTGEVFLEDCRVPVANRLGGEGAGAAIFALEMDWERACLFAAHMGAMQHQLEICIDYAKTRRSFGQPIGKFQAISHVVAEMAMRLELSRLLLYKVGWLIDRGRPAALESAMAKLFVSESYVASSLDAIQIHGAHGYATESGVERDLRDAVASRIYSGTSQIQRNLIATHLGL